MLSFDQQKAIFRSFPQLQEKVRSDGRIDYFYPDSLKRGKRLAIELASTGNGYVIGKYMKSEIIKPESVMN